MQKTTLSFKELKLDRINWSEGLYAYSKEYFQEYFGYYILDKTKRTRKTSTSFNCWIKKKGDDSNKQLHLIIKKKKSYYEVAITNESKAFGVGFPSNLYIEMTQKPNNQIYNHKYQYLFIPNHNGSNTIYIHLKFVKKSNSKMNK